MYKNRKHLLKTCRYLMTIARRAGAKKVVAKIKINDGKDDQADFLEIALSPGSTGEDLEKQIFEKSKEVKGRKATDIKYLKNKRTQDTWYFLFELQKKDN